jgi:hypothetical protein
MARNRPSDVELLDAVIEFLETEVDAEVTRSDVRFKLRVAMNVLRTVARECESGAEHDERERALLQELLGSDSADLDELNEALCERVRQGEFESRHDELVRLLTEITMDKLSIDNPRYSTYKELNRE